ncbi:MAG: asparagine synthase-related protein [Candidatus Sulfotelmatobacter sp.]
MSVQAGIWNFDGRPIDRKLLADISESLKHQGPDGESCHVDGSIALLYRPFYSTAESRCEKQPYLSDRGFMVTWDGRLDNRNELILELRSELEGDPTDVAIVAAAFDRWESDCFRRLVGDWAVSIWKSQQRELLLAVDYMAIRHIFYFRRSNQVLWSTDLRPLVLLSGSPLHLDDNYIAGYLAREPDAHLTPYREIRQVPPGQFVSIRHGSVSVERFWRFSPRSRIRYKTDAEYEEHFRHLFRQSVRRRLRSDSAVLAELSGGLDSSSIVCMADDISASEGEHLPRVDTISYYDNTEPNGDDSIYFQQIEKHRGRVGIHIDGSKLGRSRVSLECSEFCPLPGALGVGQQLGDERAAVLRAGGYRVVLSGIGGDEFMGGIPDPRAHLADLILQFKLISLAKQLTTWSLVKRKPWIQLLWESAIDALPHSLGQYLVKEAKVEPWLRKDFVRRTRLAIRQLVVDEHFGLWLPTRRSYIGGVFLMASKLAKYAPSVSAPEEARYPYLDQNLIEFILSIPASQLLRPGERRSLMRRSLAGIVPGEVLSRSTKQVGARTPALVLEGHWVELQSIYDRSLSAGLGYVDEKKFLKVISDARAGQSVPIVRILWAISLEYWLRDLAGRGLFDPPMTSSSLTSQHELHVSASHRQQQSSVTSTIGTEYSNKGATV